MFIKICMQKHGKYAIKNSQFTYLQYKFHPNFLN